VTNSGRGGAPAESFRQAIRRPIFVVSSPRAGSTLLFDTLIQAPGLCSTGGESHGLIEGIRALHPQANGWESNRLTARDARPEVLEELSRRFLATLRDRDGSAAGPALRMIEKTPKNSLRIPFLDFAWPDSTFVYLYRDARETMASMIEAWLSGGFRTYPRLPGWTGLPWSLLLVPGWRELNGLPLPEIVARQWAATTAALLDDLERLPQERVRVVSFGAFLVSPQEVVSGLCESLDLEWDRTLGPLLPVAHTAVSTPRADKWRAREAEIEAVWPLVRETDERARDFCAGRAGVGPGAGAGGGA
jgi:hypothetical protein